MKLSQYWDKAWSLVDGCTPCSPGCDHCWSASLAHTFMVEGEPGHRNGVITNEKGQFNGTVIMRSDRLQIPLKTKKPTVFGLWNDLYHNDVSDNFRHNAHGTMAMQARHIYLVLTKRPENLVRFADDHPPLELPNVWHGLTICNQQEAYEKQSDFKKVPGNKLLSLEPLLSDIPFLMFEGIKAVILGCETGPHRRQCNHEWIRSIVEQCKAAGVPCFVKQISIQTRTPSRFRGGTVSNKISHDMNEWPEDLRVRQLPWRKV